MPTYEYRCNACGHTFTREASISEQGSSKPTCPKCNSDSVAQSFSSVFVQTSKKS